MRDVMNRKCLPRKEEWLSCQGWDSSGVQTTRPCLRVTCKSSWAFCLKAVVLTYHQPLCFLEKLPGTIRDVSLPQKLLFLLLFAIICTWKWERFISLTFAKLFRPCTFTYRDNMILDDLKTFEEYLPDQRASCSRKACCLVWPTGEPKRWRAHPPGKA